MTVLRPLPPTGEAGAAAGGQLAVTADDGALLGEAGWSASSWGPESSCWRVDVRLLPEHRGAGHGTTALRLLADHLFAQTPAERVEAVADVADGAARASLTRAGFQFEGVVRRAGRRDGEVHDLALYSRLRP